MVPSDAFAVPKPILRPTKKPAIRDERPLLRFLALAGVGVLIVGTAVWKLPGLIKEWNPLKGRHIEVGIRPPMPPAAAEALAPILKLDAVPLAPVPPPASQPAPKAELPSNEPAPAPLLPVPEEPVPSLILPPRRVIAKPKAAPVWVFEGSLYDMISLRPIAFAQLTFTEAGKSKKFKATSEGNGIYRVRLPSTRNGYRLSVAHSDYREEYFDEISPPYRSMEIEDRKALQAATSMRHAPWVGRTDGATTRDMILFPLVLNSND